MYLEEVQLANMFLHDVIKIQYTNMGYLPGYPYHLISDEEMFNAFLKTEGFFDDYYPCPGDSLLTEYEALKSGIAEKITAYMLKEIEELPSWIYSYMLNEVISFSSSPEDISYLYSLTGIEPPLSAIEFSEELAQACYDTSLKWLQKQPAKYSDRPVAIFGEPHVIKSLRLDQVNILSATGES